MVEVYEYGLEFRGERFKRAEVGLNALGKRLSANMDGYGKIVSKELRSHLTKVINVLTTFHGKPWPGGATSTTLARRSGAAVQSLRAGIKVTGNRMSNVQAAISGIGYLQTHERGATIRARKAKFLTIPLDAALNADGTPIKPKARDWKNTFVAQSRKGNLLIFQKRGAGIVPLYALKREVVIPPRLRLAETVIASLPTSRTELLINCLKIC